MWKKKNMYQKENNNKTFENKKLSELGIYIYMAFILVW